MCIDFIDFYTRFGDVYRKNRFTRQPKSASAQTIVSLGLDPVVQCLSGDAQDFGDRRQALSAFDHTHRFELELQRVSRP
jgi:hypothetical protein